MDHSQIMGMIASSASWEQIIYDVVAEEGLDPWNLDLTKLAGGFLKHIEKLETMDFKIPAKYAMVSATLLRMKSDNLSLLDYFHQAPEDALVEDGVTGPPFEVPALNPLSIPPMRQPQRKIVVSELIEALRKVLSTVDRREMRIEVAREKIKIHHEDITKRISALYDKINAVLYKINKPEVEFSSLVTEWNRKGVADTFLPLVYLDHQKKVECRQEDFFKEIFVRKIGAVVPPAPPVKDAPPAAPAPAPKQGTSGKKISKTPHAPTGFTLPSLPLALPLKQLPTKGRTTVPASPQALSANPVTEPIRRLSVPKAAVTPKTAPAPPIASKQKMQASIVKAPVLPKERLSVPIVPKQKSQSIVPPVKKAATIHQEQKSSLPAGWVPIKEKPTKKKRRKR